MQIRTVRLERRVGANTMPLTCVAGRPKTLTVITRLYAVTAERQCRTFPPFPSDFSPCPAI